MNEKLELSELAQKSERLTEEASKTLSQAGFGFKIPEDQSDKIRIVFAGQYNAGKSSILKALTGREDIVIGGGITTDRPHSYNWQGLEVIDTPGIESGLRPDHDKLSYDAIAAADMLVFVITNELFDDYIAKHFRKLAIDKDKAGEMILVVNQMDRTSGGNTEEQRAVLRDDLRKVLEPYTPEQLNLTFIAAESYLDGINEPDTELAEEYIRESGYDDFIKTLNSFAQTKNLPAKLTTNLYEVERRLETAYKELLPEFDNPDIKALYELYLQQKHTIIEAGSRLDREVKDIISDAANKIREIGMESANLIHEGCEEKEVENELEKADRRVNDIVRECENKINETIEKRLIEIGVMLDDIENTEFSVELRLRLSSKLNILPPGLRKKLENMGNNFKNIGDKIGDLAFKDGAKGGFKLTNFTDGVIHKMVLKIGKLFGYKFKPWEATKIAKGIGVGAQILSAAGVVLSICMQAKADADEDKLNEELKNSRLNIRGEFNTAAYEFENHYSDLISQNIREYLEEPIEGINSSLHEIDESSKNKSRLCKDMEKLRTECRDLIKDIHAAYSS